MKNESEVWERVKAALPPEVMARRIEDASGALGTWDVWLGCRGRGLWLELKFTETGGAKPKLRPGQAAFGHDLAKAEVTGFYIVGDRKGGMRVLDQWYLGDDWRKALIFQDKIWSDAMIKKIVGDNLEV